MNEAIMYPDYNTGIVKEKDGIRMHYSTHLRLKYNGKYYIFRFYATDTVRNDTPKEIMGAIKNLNIMAYEALTKCKVDLQLTDVHGGRIYILDNNQNE